VARLVDFVHRGPRGASVDDVDVRDEHAEGLTGFRLVG
jgi:hypothetical protein